MKKEMKQYIKASFYTPSSLRKEEFIKSLNYPKTRKYEFVINQIGYINKKNWLFSSLLFLLASYTVSLLQLEQTELLWSISAFLPFLAMITVIETMRSAAWGLAELEMTTRHSLKSILLVRIGILGAGNAILLFTLMPFLAGAVHMEFLKTSVYLLVPYLFTCLCSYSLASRIRSKEFSYYCAGIAAAVSGIGLIFGRLWYVIYEQKYFILWLMVFAVLSVLLAKEIRKLIKNSEDLIWNSCSTV